MKTRNENLRKRAISTMVNLFDNNDYIVTWAFGHLFSLYDIEDYEKNPDKKWRMDNLPCFPEKFKFKLKELGDYILFQTLDFLNNNFIIFFMFILLQFVST